MRTRKGLAVTAWGVPWAADHSVPGTGGGRLSRERAGRSVPGGVRRNVSELVLGRLPWYPAHTTLCFLRGAARGEEGLHPGTHRGRQQPLRKHTPNQTGAWKPAPLWGGFAQNPGTAHDADGLRAHVARGAGAVPEVRGPECSGLGGTEARPGPCAQRGGWRGCPAPPPRCVSSRASSSGGA